MSLNAQQLDAAVSDPEIAALSDADAATLLSTPILTPRTDITFKTLIAIDVLGVSKTAVLKVALDNAVVASKAPGADQATQIAGAEVDLILSALAGPGFDATDPQAATLVPTFVALSDGAITNADAQKALNTISYRCGGVVVAADIAASRSRVSGYAAMERLVINQYNAAIAWLASGQAAGTASPVAAAVLAKLGTAQ